MLLTADIGLSPDISNFMVNRTAMPEKVLTTYYPKSKTDWRNWLSKHHDSTQSIWLVYYKTSSNKPTLSWSEAVDEALCFGWIDSTKKAIDKESYMQYFCKRKPNSIWSKINKEKVARLIENNLMTEAGLKSIATAKENGSWNALDDVEALIVPNDLTEALAGCKEALAFFNRLSNSTKKLLLHWVTFAKRPKTRAKRIAEIVESAHKSLKPKQFR
ncbi:YdeI/OmpD-associated family protein [uncultured Roseivirga sp.]|uniref:YdeI/OmpD-associated family protein n=1 Tax=Roseivirga sp. UBA838 TaxID=1947393 RepID=UPI0032B150B3|tara:strand:+ start:2383 stop:3030 length:648 start_codon:yes stop_codon:yes gene_type:complete